LSLLIISIMVEFVYEFNEQKTHTHKQADDPKAKCTCHALHTRGIEGGSPRV
jgi:hypothetical protein